MVFKEDLFITFLVLINIKFKGDILCVLEFWPCPVHKTNLDVLHSKFKFSS